MEPEEVEVVYSIESVRQAVLLVLLGAYIGFSIGVGMSWGEIYELANNRPVINGDVTIRANNRPVTLENIDINGNGANYTLKIIEKE